MYLLFSGRKAVRGRERDKMIEATSITALKELTLAVARGSTMIGGNEKNRQIRFWKAAQKL